MSLPPPRDVVQKVRAARCVGAHINALSRYVTRCLDREECPQPSDMVRALLPQVNARGLIYECFRWDMTATD